MKFALLGADSESVALAEAAEAAGHAIVWCGDLVESDFVEGGGRKAEGGGRRTEGGLWIGEDLGETWEVLLDQSAVDAVIVGRGQRSASLRSEQVNQLTKNGIAVLTTFPLVDSVLSYYEIDMSRGESNAVLQHFNPLVEQQPILKQCAEWVAGEHPHLGAIEQVVWERPLSERTQQRVLWHFSRDVELLASVAGRLNRLGALGSPDEAATYAGLSVQLLGKSEVPVRWQVGPVEENASSRLVLIAERGRVTVEFNEADCAVQMSVSQQGKTETTVLEEVDSASQAIKRFATAVQADDGSASNSSASTWTRALAAMELTDTIEIALRRGRMIEVHQQQLTEQMAFKGTMSAIGCGVLLVIPPLLLFCGWVAELIGLPVAKYWPHVLLALLTAFLGLQVIPKLLFRDPKNEQPE